MRGRGRFIAFEGGEGAGKSTQARVLASALGAELTREPGGSDLGEEIRRLLLGPVGTVMDPRAELMLMLAARAQHVTERIRPALESGRDVVVDRYSGSTLAYQGYGRGLPLAAVKEACDLATSDLWPDLSVLLDIPVNLGAARRAGAGGAPDRIESERQEFHERVTDGFRRLAADDPEHWVVIDGMGAPDEVAALVRHAVDSMLGQRAVS